MAVRKTESRLPDGFEASDLGESAVAADGRSALISYVTTPLTQRRDNTYVVFVVDAALAASVETYEWTFTECGEAPRTFTTGRGIAGYTPSLPGPFSVAVRLLDSATSVLGTLALDQYVVRPRAEIEEEIADAVNAPGPGAGNPDVLRELVSEHSLYYLASEPQSPEVGDAFKRLTYSFVWDGAQRREASERTQHVERLADSINSGSEDLAQLVAQGVGVSDLRLGLLAMAHPAGAPLLPWTELPDSAARAIADEKICAAIAGLPEATRIDLFNATRFPKSNIRACALTLEALRDRYFPATSFEACTDGPVRHPGALDHPPLP